MARVCLRSLVRGTIIAIDDNAIQTECVQYFHLDFSELFLSGSKQKKNGISCKITSRQKYLCKAFFPSYICLCISYKATCYPTLATYLSFFVVVNTVECMLFLYTMYFLSITGIGAGRQYKKIWDLIFEITTNKI